MKFLSFFYLLTFIIKLRFPKNRPLNSIINAKVYISCSENGSVGKWVCRKMCLSENLTVGKVASEKLCRKNCVGKFAVGKFVVGKTSGYPSVTLTSKFVGNYLKFLHDT